MMFSPVPYRLIFFVICVTLLPAAISGKANAQGIFEDRVLEGKPIERRMPEDLQPQGLVFKGFLYRPRLVIEGGYDSNVLAEEDNKKSDYVVAARPGIYIEKKSGAHNFFLEADANIERFATRSDEDKEEFLIFSGGRFVANSKWSFPFRLRYNDRIRDRSTPTETQLSKTPLGIQSLEALAGASRQFNRLNLTLRGEFRDVALEDGEQIDTGAPVVFSDGDRQEYAAVLSAKYDVLREERFDEIETSLFADLRVERQEYERRQFTGRAFDGDSGDRDEFGVMAGIRTNYKGLLFARIGAGAFHQNFDQDNLDSITNFDLTAQVNYLIRPYLNLRFDAVRDIDQDNGFLTGITRTLYLAGFDYEIRRNIIWESDLYYEGFDFEEFDREDEEIGGEFRLRYLHTDNLSSQFEFGYLDRASDLPEEEFDRLYIMFSLRSEL